VTPVLRQRKGTLLVLPRVYLSAAPDRLMRTLKWALVTTINVSPRVVLPSLATND